MSQQATIRGEVCFRAGDGAQVEIPDGPVDIDVTDESVTLHWTEDAGRTPGTAAITRDEYARYLKEGRIRLAGN